MESAREHVDSHYAGRRIQCLEQHLRHDVHFFHVEPFWMDYYAEYKSAGGVGLIEGAMSSAQCKPG